MLSIIVFQTVAMHGRASIQSCRRGPAGREPTGQGKQIETYLCAHVAVHGQPPAGLGWLAAWRVASEPTAGAGGTLALARACSGAGAGG